MPPFVEGECEVTVRSLLGESRDVKTRHVLIALALVAALCRASVAAEAPSPERKKKEGQHPGPALGWILTAEQVEALPLSTQDPEHPAVMRLTASWGEIEREAGVYDWSAIEPAVARLHASGYRLALCLTGSNPLYLPDGSPPSPLVGDSLDRWVAFVRSAVSSFAGRVGVYELWDGPARPPEGSTGPAYDPAIYAFVLKSSALAARAEAKAAGAELLVAEGALDAQALEWQKTLWTHDVAPYIDILPVRIAAGAGGPSVTEILSGVFAESVLHPPAPEIWAYLEPAAEASPASAPAAAIEALGSSGVVALALAPADPGLLASLSSWMLGLHGALATDFAPAPRGSLSFTDLSGAPLAGPRVLGRFVNEEDLSTLIVYDPAAAGPPGEQALLVLDVSDALNARVIDPVTGQVYPSAVGLVPGGGGGGRKGVGILLLDHPLAVRFERAAATTLELEREKLEVETARGLTAEEIIARYQQVQKLQDDHLQGWIARGRVDFHFKLAQGGGSVDVSIDSIYFWERGGELEWEQTDYYINGNKVTWKRMPELPLIQPEKVVTLPLDLTLDKTYAYRLAGEDRVGDRDAYVLAFEPADSKAPLSLYRGRVWIDKESFVRLQMSVVQTGLEAPVLSNEELDVFQPVPGPDGEPLWLLSRIEGQQLWTAGGRNFVVQRELTFTSFEINPERARFEERRRSAYASEHQMLRDTERGFRYLERQPDGSRTVKESVDSSQFFAAGGLYKDSSISAVVPLGGVNYFNYDVAGKNIQMNVFFAGVLGFFNATVPDLFGSKIDAAAEATGFALKRTDKIFQGDVELEPQRVEFRSQNVSARIGIPAGQFVKFTLIGDMTFYSFGRADETDPSCGGGATPCFELPRDHRLTTGSLQAEFNRKGYSLAATASSSRRSRWEPWGAPDAGGSFPDFDPSQKSFSSWTAKAFKEWYLPKFQKVKAEAGYLEGSDLDRFSQFQFSFFGDARLNGFSGTGVRFDRGTIWRGGYAFNLFEVIRLDATLETARVKQKRAGAVTESFTGIGLSGNFVGPWKTVISLSYGRALASDIPDLEGKQEFLVVVLKLF